MRFSAITLLALGATTTAYVVPNNKVVDNAVKARMQGSGPINVANLVSALAGRSIEARHHAGKANKGGKKAQRDAEAQEFATQEEEDAHFADLHQRDEEFATQAEEDAHFADLHTRDPHHAGKANKGGKKANA
ncbi:hypothetical protein PtrEW7m1_008230 [Pyrenophora tritici-repentis]|nr:hypothetical protein PtrEW7m1_008230 [Pyrenophora tritici-repentis]